VLQVWEFDFIQFNDENLLMAGIEGIDDILIYFNAVIIIVLHKLFFSFLLLYFSIIECL